MDETTKPAGDAAVDRETRTPPEPVAGHVAEPGDSDHSDDSDEWLPL